MSADQQPVEPLLVKIDRAAELLGVSEATMYRLIAAGEIDTVRFGRTQRVPHSELERLIQRRLGQAS